MTRRTVLATYAVFAVVLLSAIGLVVACERYEARDEAIQARSWDADRNQWRDGYDWRAQARTHERLVEARTGAAIAVIVAALACAVVSGMRGISRPLYWLPALLFTAVAALLALALAVAGAVGGGGMVGAVRAFSPGMLTLAIDIGGTGLKATVLDPHGVPTRDRQRVATPSPATPKAVLDALEALVTPLGPFDRISCGFPGIVWAGVVRSAPNLNVQWSGIDVAARLAGLFKKPTRVLNDAGVQGLGVISGRGLEMVLTLGTGMGCGLFYEGVYIPNLELGHHPFRADKSYEHYLGLRGLERHGVEKWNQRLAEAIEQITPVWNPDRIYLGGGNAKHVAQALPPHVQVISNTAGLLGGIALWDGREGLELSKVERTTRTAHPAAAA